MGYKRITRIGDGTQFIWERLEGCIEYTWELWKQVHLTVVHKAGILTRKAFDAMFVGGIQANVVCSYAS